MNIQFPALSVPRARALRQLFTASVITLLSACTGESTESSHSVQSSHVTAPSSTTVTSSSLSSELPASSAATTSSTPAASNSPCSTDTNSALCSAYERGQTVYAVQCTACHADDGAGKTGSPPVKDHNCTSKVEGSCGDIDGLAHYTTSAMPPIGDKCTDQNGSSCANDVATYIVYAFAPAITQDDIDGDGILSDADLCPNTPKEEHQSIDHNGCTQNSGEPTDVLAINVAGERFTTQSGTVYQADDAQYYDGALGATAGDPNHDVANTTDDALYRKERWGTALTYKLPVANGNYSVELHFAEVFHETAGKRVMNVAIEDNTQLTDYDIFAEAGGKNVAKIERFDTITVSDGELTIDFIATVNNASVVAIRVSSAIIRDADNDGVPDEQEGEHCPGTQPDTEVNTLGCSVAQRDKDGDGILLPDDICPDTVSADIGSVAASGELAGCSERVQNLDTDSDGIADVIDRCDGTPLGDNVGSTGCSVNTALSKANPVSPQMRLTEREYAQTVTEAFGLSSLPNVTLQADTWGPFRTFNNNASDNTADFAVFVNAAVTIGHSVAPSYANLCNWDTQPAECVRSQLGDAFKTVLRTTELSDTDITAVSEVITHSLADGSTTEQAVAAGIARVLVDDRTIYRMELSHDASLTGEALLSDREYANRIAYLLVDQAPDDALVSQIVNLVNNSGAARTEADRLMAGPHFKESLWTIIAQWLNIPATAPSEDITAQPSTGDQCNLTSECASQYAQLAQSFDCQNSASNTSVCLCDNQRCDSLVDTPEPALSLSASAHEETRRFVDYIVDNDLPITELFSAKYSFINTTLAEHYGVDAPDSDWARYDFPASAQRQGILTHASFLTSNGKHGRDRNTIFRGKVVFERLFCDQMAPPPPPELSTALGDEIDDRTTHPSCKNCHSVVDPIGRIFDGYDDYGQRFASAELEGSAYMDLDVDGEYQDTVELSSAIANSRAFTHCFSRQLFRSALGRDVTETDQASFDAVRSVLESGGAIKAALQTLVTTETFTKVYSTPNTSCAVGE